MRLYLAEKMMGLPFFNAPWFYKTAEELRKLPGVTEVFNPAQYDRICGFEPMECPNGTLEEALAAGFDRTEALRYDWNWIATRSEGIIVGPMWRCSIGAISEVACHQALGLPGWDAHSFIHGHPNPLPPLLRL